MTYDYLAKDQARGQRFTLPKGQFIAGHAIGIVHLEVWYPLLPGNVVNATTYDFPVLYQRLRGGTQDRIHNADPAVVDLIIEAGRELERQGVRAIAGACGYLGNYQREVAAELDVPVFLSSLLQVQMIYRSLKPGQRVGIMCADAPSITPQLLKACGVTPDVPVAVLGLGDQPQFGNILNSRGEFDYDEIQQEVVDGARRLVEKHPDVGAILLECSDMPPFAWAVQHAVRLPVFDFITMINWIYRAVVQRPYEGFI